MNRNFQPTFDDNMDLFSRNRWTLSVADLDQTDVSMKFGVGSAKQARSGLDDLLSSNDGGKHDYDWLLTPPGTPLIPSSDGGESQPASVAPRSGSLTRATSTTKTSRLSISQSERNHVSRPTRSSSVTRPSISTTQYSTYLNKSTSILNTSSSSVSSFIRPSTPTTRSSSTARPSTSSSCLTQSRSSTPSRTRPSLTTSSIDKTKPSQNSSPSTPTSRSQFSPNLNSPSTWSASRPSTPARRNSAPSPSPSGPSISNVRNTTTPGSRPSSPGSRVRPPPQPIVLPDFSLDAPPNLRTTLPDRPISAGRSRPGATVTVKGNIEIPSSKKLPRRQSSPAVTGGRTTELNGRGRVHANGQVADKLESRKASHVLESSTRKPVKASTEGTGFGRSISKKSLDMAIRHMDIRNGRLSGSALFPQSIRSTNPKGQPDRASSALASVNGIKNNGLNSENGNYINKFPKSGTLENKNSYPSEKLTEVNIYESSRYDAILLKEDLMNTNWLHSGDDKSDQEPLFDSGFETLPEPFGSL